MNESDSFKVSLILSSFKRDDGIVVKIATLKTEEMLLFLNRRVFSGIVAERVW